MLRYIGAAGDVDWAMSCRVVEDGPDRTALFNASGTKYKRADWNRSDPLAPRNMEDHAWSRRDVLRLMYPGLEYSIWLFWDESDRSFTGWYVNVEAPFRRTEIGFDTTDFELDIVVSPDLSWRMKDEDDLRILVEHGVYSSRGVDRIHQTARSAIQRLENRETPFNEPWQEWQPGPLGTPVDLPSNWDLQPEIPSDEISVLLNPENA